MGRVLDRFTELKLVDDAAYAQAYVRTGVQVRRRGTRSLTMELHQRGVDPEIAAAAAAEVDGAVEYETASELARRRLRSLTRYEPQVRRRRLTGLLLRRGFGASVVGRVVSETLAAATDRNGAEACAVEPDDG